MQLLSIKECAALTNLSASWWRMKVFKREIRFLKVGRRVLIPKSTIDELLNRSVVEPKIRHKAALDLGEPNK